MLKLTLLLTAFLYSTRAFYHLSSRYSPNGVKKITTYRNEKIDAMNSCKVSSRDSSKYYGRKSMEHLCAPAVAWGEGLSQEDLMNKDECILVDDNDLIIGHDSKYNSHRFDKKNPTGILHRAFSVFLFNEQGNLLLQRRAADKITFPSVWTNTCCSHPLYGYSPCEVDDEDSVNEGSLLGIKSAAIRKLKHELGIESPQVCIENIKYLGRIHYCAADDSTAEPAAGAGMNGSDEGAWGEHEIDYILFIKATVDLVPNPEEVGDWKYVTYQELKDMMNPSIPQGRGLKWSPWFRHIVDSLLVEWWRDLNATLTTDICVDKKNIYRF